MDKSRKRDFETTTSDIIGEGTKKRAGKTTSQQYRIIVEELKQNVAFKTNKNSPENPNALQETWDKLTKQLNSVGGPIRTIESWKRVFVDWKSHVKRKARQYKINQNKTRDGPPTSPLNDLENELIDAIGTVAIDGLTKVQEFGLTSDENPSIIFEVVECADEPPCILGTDILIQTENNSQASLPQTDVKQNKPKSRPKLNLKKHGIDAVVDTFMRNNNNKGIVEELNGIKKQMRKSNKIKKFKVKLEYEIAKIKYTHLNLEEAINNLSDDSE